MNNENWMEEYAVLAALTEQGIVLLSDKAKVTPEEDSCLYHINQSMVKRMEEQHEVK